MAVEKREIDSIYNVIEKVVGYDFGYGENKIFYLDAVVLGSGGTGSNRYNQFKFPSVTYIPERITKIDSVLSSNGIALNNLMVEFNEQTIYIGEKAIKQDVDGGSENFEKDRFRDDTATAQLLVGLALMRPNAINITVEDLMIGLSLESYGNFKNEIQDFYSGKSFEFKAPDSAGNMRNVTVKIQHVNCSPQGIGAYYDRFIEFSGLIVKLSGENSKALQEERYGVIDVGRKTTDFFAAEGLEIIDGSDECLDFGTSYVYENLSKRYNNAPAKLIENTYLKGKSVFNYEGKDYYDFLYDVQNEFDSMAESIARRIQAKWRQQLKRIHKIVLCGGGAIKCYEKLGKLIERPIIVAEDPQFSNARGYFKLGWVQRGEFEE